MFVETGSRHQAVAEIAPVALAALRPGLLNVTECKEAHPAAIVHGREHLFFIGGTTYFLLFHKGYKKSGFRRLWPESTL